jgi:hypothetical protein
MATKFYPSDPDRSAEYTPGSQQFPSVGGGCLGLGDRVVFRNVRWKAFAMGVSDLTADASGLWPCWAYAPGYVKNADPKRLPVDEQRARDGFLFGNDSAPVVYTDFGVGIATNGGDFRVEGGDGPGGDAGVLLITWTWERPALTRGQSAPARGVTHDTISYYGVRGSMNRPDFAADVYTPDAQSLTLDSGPGTTSVVVPCNFAQPAKLGPFQRVTVSGTVGTLIFGICR